MSLGGAKAPLHPLWLRYRTYGTCNNIDILYLCLIGPDLDLAANITRVSQTFAPAPCLIKLSCDSRFRRAFTACVLKEITSVGWNQGNYFENATACSKRTLKTIVATQS